MAVALELEDLRKSFDEVRAVDGLNLAVEEGEILGLLGPNGAGKTTCISMICGLLRPDSGRIRFKGIEMDGRGEEQKRRVGLCPQAVVVWERLTVRENLEFLARLYGLRPALTASRTKALLEALDLSAKAGKQAKTLSGGMQRRLNIALALVHDPELVVLDESEAGLDPQSRNLVRDYIRSLARDKTVILTTHNMDEAERICDRVGIIDQGRLIALDTPQGLLESHGPDGTKAADLEEVFIALTGRRLRE